MLFKIDKNDASSLDVIFSSLRFTTLLSQILNNNLISSRV